ncbi:hypothetical protein ZIOFF_039556 [Zingiber officinale]|uniref:Uncharacterized protein n=1 Tax=Zingiber officinale TaxID=94328 RepID=A0A8J5KXA1_ZINOF|nr:hypothetical protein ZIOFF_039556 [Zingiber officinale]
MPITGYMCIDQKKLCLLLITTKQTEVLFKKKAFINYGVVECNISTWEFFRYEYKYCIDNAKEQWRLLSSETIDGKVTKQFWQQWRGYEAWQNSEVNLLITKGLVGRLSNTPNVGFAYEIQGVVDYLTSHGVKALPGRSFSTSRLQDLNWTINPTQIAIPMQSAEVNSQTMMDGRISLSFSNYAAAQPAEEPKYNNNDEEILAVLIETHPRVFTHYEGTEEEYFENYGDYDEYMVKGKQVTEQEEERYSFETHILVNRMFPQAILPKWQTEGSVGLDIAASHASIIEPYGKDLIHTGLRMEIPINLKAFCG